MKKKKKLKTKRQAKKTPSKISSLGRPYGDRVLVRPGKQEETTSFGLIIPDTAKEKPEQGTVVAVGPGRKGDRGESIPMQVKVGDRVMFSKYGYDEVKIGGVDYYLIREESITYVF